jgi:hypothetical protein
MKPLFLACAIALFIPLFAAAQSTILTGYAVVTPVSGSGAGVTVSETFTEQVGGTFFQSTVIASPLVTLTDIVVNADPRSGLDTGIAIVNPNNTPVAITLTLGNQVGVPSATRTFTLGGGQQISQFVTQFFAGNVVTAAPIKGLLFVNSTLPVSVMALAFTGFSFTSLPATTQLTTINTTTAAVQNGIIGVTSTTPVGVVNGIAAVAAPIPSTITQIPATFPGLSTPQLAAATTITPITGIAPTTAVVPLTGTIPLTGVPITGFVTTGTNTQITTTVPVNTTVVAPGVFVVPQITVGVGGPGAQILPQVAVGGGWTSQITIANTSGVAQVFRVDFFTTTGAPLPLSTGSTINSIVIPAGGVTTITATM